MANVDLFYAFMFLLAPLFRIWTLTICNKGGFPYAPVFFFTPLFSLGWAFTLSIELIFGHTLIPLFTPEILVPGTLTTF